MHVHTGHIIQLSRLTARMSKSSRFTLCGVHMYTCTHVCISYIHTYLTEGFIGLRNQQAESFAAIRGEGTRVRHGVIRISSQLW